MRIFEYTGIPPSLPPFLPNYAARVIFEKSVSVCRGARALYVDRDITRQQQLLSPIAFQYSCSRGERERMLAETGGQLSRCIIQKSSKRNIAAAFLRIPSYSRLLFAETTSALFRKLAARKQIVPRSEPRGNTRLVYCIHIHANNCNNSATRVIDTRVSDYRVNGSLVFSLSFLSFPFHFHDFFLFLLFFSLSLSLSFSFVQLVPINPKRREVWKARFDTDFDWFRKWNQPWRVTLPPRDARLPFMNVNVFPIGRSDSLILIIERGEEEGGEREKESLEIIEEGLPRICRVRVTAICIPDIANYVAD